MNDGVQQHISRFLSDPRRGKSNPRKHESGPDLLDFLLLVDGAEREMLFETFRVWQDTEGSVGGAAEVLT
jgi:hypothetical protein